jgi:hypothetical protein
VWPIPIERWVDREVEVEVDFGGIARQLGERAVKSRGGKSVLASGLVVVRRVIK